jgi:hypothetical protein
MLPYTYLIGWSTKNRWYYGVRYGAKAHPDDLWKSYFTSSKYVRAFATEHGPPDVIRVRRTFASAAAAREWETRVLRRMRVVEDDRFLNLNHGDGKFFASPETIDLLRTVNIGRKASTHTRQKLREAKIGTTKTVAHRKAISTSLTGRSRSVAEREGISKAMKGAAMPDWANHLNRETFYCEQCNKSMNKGNFKRWHQH